MGILSTELESKKRSAETSNLPPDESAVPEVSIVMPCLNEAETLAGCISKAQDELRVNKTAGEIIVADNGSSDGSSTIAARLGARVVHVKDRGYGSALRGGIEAARGKYVITVDADDSHDATQIPLFLAKLREGYDLVVGNRFKGRIEAGAMEPLHRYLGNPVLTRIAKLFFTVRLATPSAGSEASVNPRS